VPDSPLERLLELQAHDTAADRLRHRRATLAERGELAAATTGLRAAEARIVELDAQRREADAQERRLADEVASVAARASEVERSMYSGEIASPRELQAMQADVEQLRRQQRTLEDRELTFMEARDVHDAALRAAQASGDDFAAQVARLGQAIEEHERGIDAELATEVEARRRLVAELPDRVVATYEQCRAKANGVGAARLVGMTCQGCHLTIPATEVDRMRREAHAGGPVGLTFCDNCGAILVLS
jgi:predicted  nucleic acid-binding Zn-ribbon protein